MFVLVSGVSTATSPRWRVIYISRLGSRLWDRPAKPGIADRGRSAPHGVPPAKIRTGGFPAYGSHLGCLTAKRSLGQG